MRSIECDISAEEPKYKTLCDLIDTEERISNLASPSKASKNLKEQFHFELHSFYESY